MLQHSIEIILAAWPATRAILCIALLPSRIATEKERLHAERARLRARRAAYELESVQLGIGASEFELPAKR